MTDVAQRANFEQLYDTVFGLIRNGRYRPGDRIGIKDLSERLKVSPTPLREILSRLVGRGIVEERRSEGYYLARLDARDIADLYRHHLSCLERASHAIASPDIRPPDGDGDVWDVFAHLAAGTGDRVLADLQHYLADRLAIVRRCETHLFERCAEDLRLRAAILRGATSAELRSSVRSFHRMRWRAAQDLSLLLGRG